MSNNYKKTKEKKWIYCIRVCINLLPISRFTLKLKSLKTLTTLAHLQQLSSALTNYPLAYRLLKSFPFSVSL